MDPYNEPDSDIVDCDLHDDPRMASRRAVGSAKSRGTAAFQVEPSAMIVSERIQASDAPGTKITVSVEPASVSRRQAILRLNEEIEGRSSAADTYASKTAG
jgi:hypothetical protein